MSNAFERGTRVRVVKMRDVDVFGLTGFEGTVDRRWHNGQYIVNLDLAGERWFWSDEIEVIDSGDA